MKPSDVINGIDLKMLDKQRNTLNKIINNPDTMENVSKQQQDHLKGLQNFLDLLSDSLHEEKK